MKAIIIEVLQFLKNHPGIDVTVVAIYEILVSMFPTFKKSKSIVNLIILLYRFFVPDLVHKNQTNTNDLKDTKLTPTILGIKRVWV
jgi:hypothetical protein